MVATYKFTYQTQYHLPMQELPPLLDHLENTSYMYNNTQLLS